MKAEFFLYTDTSLELSGVHDVSLTLHSSEKKDKKFPGIIHSRQRVEHPRYPLMDEWMTKM